MHVQRTAILAGSLLATVACSDRAPLGPAEAEYRKTAVTPTGPWARVVEGRTGPGSLYALYIPQSWNGEAVYFAHGVRPPQAPITLDDQDQFFQVRDALGALGYAFAYSSFSENGLAIKDGAQRTHQLRGLLASELKGQPERSYVAGYSLGALVALQLAERFPQQYDGALLACGMVGGTTLQTQYIGDVRALFDFFYPGVLPGDVISVPDSPPTQAQVQALVVGAILTNPLGLYAIASTAQTPLAFAPVGNVADPTSLAFQSLVQSLVAALYYQLIGTQDVVDRTHGHSPYDNSTTTYVLGTPLIPHPGLATMIAAANAGVQRYTSTPDAQNYLERHYEPTGDLRIPVVTLHNMWDYLVPFMHEPALAQRVGAAGATDMLVQVAIPNYGHCQFPTSTVVGAFQALANWARTGVKPAF